MENTGNVSYSGNDEIATVAGGCFWCIEAPFEKIEGVSMVISGYAGGSEPDPTYKQVSSGSTEYVEAAQIYYDPEVISYTEILDIYWKQFDPTDAGAGAPGSARPCGRRSRPRSRGSKPPTAATAGSRRRGRADGGGPRRWCGTRGRRR